MASQIRVISTSYVKAAAPNCDSTQKIELNPLDLELLRLDPIQIGLLFRKPKAIIGMDVLMEHLKLTLSSTLDFFPHLAGRLDIVEHDDDNTSSFFILCNNSGAQVAQAIAEDLAISDIVKPIYVPRFVSSFFPLNRVRNYEGTHNALLAIQVNELKDGIFYGISINHAVVDGTSTLQFFDSWFEIARGGKLSKPPTLERWFFDGISRPIRVPFPKETPMFNSLLLHERVFHFSKEKVAELKAKANAMVHSEKISSLQALLSHIWRSIVRNEGIDPEEKVKYQLVIDIRSRVDPPLPQNYFGNAALDATVSLKARELLDQKGLGKAALEMNKVVALHTEEKIMSQLKSWVEKRRLLTLSEMYGDALDMSGSPRFDVYGIDFGLGKPVAVRNGPANKTHGTITILAGGKEGDVDVEVCHSFEILEAMGKDSEFMDAVSTTSYD